MGTTSASSFKFKAVGTGGNLSGNAYYVGLLGDGSASNKGVGLGYDNTSQTGIVYAETASAASNLAFWTYSGSAWGERMRLDSSGNLGIGNTTASSFTLNASSNLAVGTGSASAGITIYTGTTNEGAISFADGVAASNVQYRGFINYSHNLDALIFGTAGAPQMRLDSAGNLGLGVTPSAWTSTWRANQVLNASFVGNNSQAYMNYNAYYDAGWKYIANGVATSYLQDNDGSHAWLKAASGTAGNTISFTQAMTLDASGNLLVGTTTAFAKLAVIVAGGANRDLIQAGVTSATDGLTVKWNHATSTIRVNIQNLPTSATGLASGDLYNLSGVLMVA